MKKNILGVVFDFDGTVVDNEGDWEMAFSKVLSDHDLEMPVLLKQANGWNHEPGAGLEANWKRVVEGRELVSQYSLATVSEYLSESKSMETILVRDGVDEVIEKVKEMGLITALATGNSWNMVEEELELIQLTLAFDTTTTGEEVMLAKPDPEIYLLTAQKLGIDPEECLVIEDAIVGVRAAKEAGCKVVGILTEYNSESLLKSAGADYVISDLREIIGIVEGLVKVNENSVEE